MVLLSTDEFSVPEICRIFGVTDDIVYKWFDRFGDEGPGGLFEFIVCHDRGEVLEVRYDDGRLALPQHEQFTEASAIDFRFEEEEDGFHDRFAKF